MKKTTIVVCSLMISLLFSGCSKPINLSTAFKNTENISTYTYDINLVADITDTDDLNTLVSFRAEGAYEKTTTREKSSANITISTEDDEITLPIYLDRANEGFDFDLFIGIPNLIKDYVPEGIDNLYISSSELDELLKENLSEEEYGIFKERLNISQNSEEFKKLAEAVITCAQTYINKNSERIQKFEPLAKKNTSKNGVFTISLNKDDIKTIVNTFLNNDEYYQLFITYFSSVNELTDTQDIPDTQTIIGEFNKSIDELREAIFVISFTVENELITNTGIVLSMSHDNEKVTLRANIQLSNIGAKPQLNALNKSAESTLSLSELIEVFFGLTPYPIDEPLYFSDNPTLD